MSIPHGPPRPRFAQIARERSALLFLFVAALAGPGHRATLSGARQQEPWPAAAQTDSGVTVTWRPDGSLRGPDVYRYELVIANHRAQALSQGWKLYFSAASAPVLEGADEADGGAAGAQAQGLRCTHGDDRHSGDYFVLEPAGPGFAPIGPGATRVVRMLVTNGSIQKTEAPAAFHILLPGQPVPLAVHASTSAEPGDARQGTRGPDDALPLQTARTRFVENAADDDAAGNGSMSVRGSLLPTPLSVEESEGRFVLVGAATTIAFAKEVEAEAQYLRAALGDLVTGAIAARAGTVAEATITLAIDPLLAVRGSGHPDPEGYALVVDRGGISIKGTDAAGVFHAIETLRQLVPIDVYRRAVRRAERADAIPFPIVRILDAPLFPYRGMHLDVARHFQSKDTVEKLLDLLAAHKLNKFHFHLSDDEGWRLQIPGLPELTDYGARRGFDPQENRMLHPAMGSTTSLEAVDGIAGKPADETAANGGVPPAYQGFEEASLNFIGQGSGYYTVADFEEILAFAGERHIDVVPEFDMPAHARAAVQSMERRYQANAAADRAKAAQYRLLDPADSTAHTSVQGYVDNLMNPCLESTYAFVAKVFGEVRAMFAAAHRDLVMLHVGGDEPPGTRWWASSPACTANPATKDLDDRGRKNYFFDRVARIVASTGATMAGWDDVLADGGPRLPGFVSMPWSNVWGEGGEDRAYEEANRGRQVVLAHATNLYMDLAYNKDPDEPGSDWANFVDERRTFEYLPFDVFSIAHHDRLGHALAPSLWAKKTRLTPAGRSNILGLQGLLWSENVKSPKLLEYMAFPKILGVAERAWDRDMPTAQTLPDAWRRFVATLGQAELPRLDFFRAVDVRNELPAPRDVGVNYRIPLPGAVVDGGMLQANLRYPGMAIEVSTDGGVSWSPYEGPTAEPPSVLLRARTAGGRTGRVSRAD